MLLAGGTEFVEVVIVLSSIVPVIGIAWFAWWFLRAGKRYDERERAARKPPAPPLSAFYAAGWMFWLTRNTLSGSYCALTRASRS